MILDGARALAKKEKLTLVEDEGLLAENAGLTEWPVPLMGSFDELSSRCRRKCSLPR